MLIIILLSYYYHTYRITQRLSRSMIITASVLLAMFLEVVTQANLNLGQTARVQQGFSGRDKDLAWLCSMQ